MISKIYISQKKKINNVLIDEEFIKLNELIINNDLTKAKYKISGLIKMINGNKKYLKYLKHYLNIINEKENTIENVNKYINQGLSYIENNEENKYNKALLTFYNGLKETKNNLFNYYIAKTFYKLKEYEKSIEFFKKYLEVGGEKDVSSYVYISKILEKYVKHKNYYEAKKCLLKAKKVSKYELSDIEIEEINIKINRLTKKEEEQKIRKERREK